MIIVGSKSLIHNNPSLNRELGDVDVILHSSSVNSLKDKLYPERIVSGDGIISFKNIKSDDIFSAKNVDILLSDNSTALQKYLKYENDKIDEIKFASDEVAFSMKKIHINFPGYFKKHILDYCFLFKKLNGVDKLCDVTKIHHIEISERIGKIKSPSLNKSTKDFFDQSIGFVKYYFVHDDIHKMVAHYENPLYMKMQPNPEVVKCSKDLWNEFTFEDKCRCVLEEAYVIALERKIFPSIFGGGPWYNSKDAIEWSLYRICTTLCSGWFRQFATDHYVDIKNMADDEYVEKFLKKYKEGKINKI